MNIKAAIGECFRHILRQATMGGILRKAPQARLESEIDMLVTML